jgi:acetyltransferase-like isoleucine patch superfamily enzyme
VTVCKDPGVEGDEEPVNDDDFPPNVEIGAGSQVIGLWHKFHSRREPALVIGENTTIDNTHFAFGPEAFVSIGDYCYLSSALLMAELEIEIGNYVVIGWNVAIADSDFHPLDPALRIQDTIANSLQHLGTIKRPPFVCRRVVIEDDVHIGANTLILKGVRVGAGSTIAPGSLLTEDVPPRSRVAGNPAEIVGQV